jgi:hypothetical protein
MAPQNNINPTISEVAIQNDRQYRNVSGTLRCPLLIRISGSLLRGRGAYSQGRLTDVIGAINP